MIDPRKAREVALCAQVAEQVNALEGTDYRAVAIERQDDIGDAKLVSATGRHPDRVMQVVSIPEDMELREDTDARQRLESRLCDALAARGIARAFLTIGLTQRGQKSGLSRDLVGQLVELILQGR